jgi:hypothetical protein
MWEALVVRSLSSPKLRVKWLFYLGKRKQDSKIVCVEGGMREESMSTPGSRRLLPEVSLSLREMVCWLRLMVGHRFQVWRKQET